MIGTATRLPAIQQLVEIKTVAEQLHFKISTLLLHGGKVLEAVKWFRQHSASYRKLEGVPEAIFLHWEWMSRQFLVFSELLETSSVTIQSISSLALGTEDNPLTEWEFIPAYHYQVVLSNFYYLKDLSFLKLTELVLHISQLTYQKKKKNLAYFSTPAQANKISEHDFIVDNNYVLFLKNWLDLYSSWNHVVALILRRNVKWSCKEVWVYSSNLPFSHLTVIFMIL